MPDKHDKPCPKCGHCPTCGRSNQVWPYQWYWQNPYWWNQPLVTFTQGNISTASGGGSH